MRGARVLLRLPAGHPGRAGLAAGAHAAAVRGAERQRHARQPARVLAVRHIALRVRLAGHQMPTPTFYTLNPFSHMQSGFKLSG